jgi:hypothetical protein
MKKITLLVAGLLLTGTLAQASGKNNFSADNNKTYSAYYDYRDAAPVVFNERGIEFMVFLTGEFDFNTQPATTGGAYYRSGTRASVAQGNAGVIVEHDYKGRVRRVGNVYVNYDMDGRVKRIGTVYMAYNSFALTKIGGMRFAYDRMGRVVDTYGNIKSNTRGTAYQAYTGNNGYGNNNNTGNGQGSSYGNNNGNEDYFYYRKDGSKAKMTAADIADIKKDQVKK